MKYSTAKKIVDQIRKHDEVFNDLTPLLDQVEDVKLRTELRKASAAVVTSMYADLLLPLKRRFPELDIGDD
ncbi:hypothetical protein [Parasphingorhabdus sp.]|uniref:hypothetical protein n=1 Tax=Parasphingorhabdus sp. TaxID=2709688 RepID=UPI003BB021F5